MRFESNLTAWTRILFMAASLLLLGLGGVRAAHAQDGEGSAKEKSVQKDTTPAKTDTSEKDSNPDVDGENSDAAEKLSYDELSARAAQAYRAKDYARASDLFRRAYAIKPVPNLLYNIGRAEEKAGNFDKAIEQYEKFVTKPGVAIKSREEGLSRLRVLRDVVDLNRPKGDSQEASQTGSDSAPDAQDSSAESTSPSTLLANPSPPPPRIERDYTLAWVSFGVAAGSFVTSGIFAAQARQAHLDFEDATSREALRDAASWGKTSSIVADSTLGLGAVFTGLGVYFLISPTEREVSNTTTSMRWSPQLGAGKVGVDWALLF